MIIAAEDEKGHDSILQQVLDRAREKNVRFNKEKMQFKVSSVHYMGHIVSAEGLKPDGEKIKAISEMPKPNDVSSLQRLLGMVKYLAPYIPHESEITAPLRQLLKKETHWFWGPEHDEAIVAVRRVLTSEPVLAYYDVQKKVTIQADASQSGLGACLMQDGKAIAYASRALTETEKNYAQIEKEMLSICYACKKFHQYISGKDSTCIHNDHKPLETIMRKPLSRAPPRLQRMMLQVQPYNLEVQHVPGKYMYVADTLSRAYTSSETDPILEQELVLAIHTLTDYLPVSKAKFSEISEVSGTDPQLLAVKKYIQQGWPRSRKIVSNLAQPYWDLRDEIHEIDGVFFVNDRIIIPKALQSAMLKLLHESHLGAEKNKARARTVLYWPNMNRDIEDTVAKCHICLKYQRNQQNLPMISHEIPDERFAKVGMDIMTYQGRDYLVVVDYYSKFPEIQLLSGKTASSIITHAKSIFARHGIPREIISDNMPFGSCEFRQFAAEWGITITTSSPQYPQSNGQAERFVQTLKNMLKKATEEGRDPYIALLEYRNTPISGLKYSPSQLLMSRLLQSKLPIASRLLQPTVVNAHEDLVKRQQTQAEYYNKHTKPLTPLKEGDVVRVNRENKWEPALVKKVCPEPRSYIIAHEHGHLRRNRKALMKTTEHQPRMLDTIPQSKNSTDNNSGSGLHSTDINPPEPPCANEPSQITVTSRGRNVKTPARYADYEMK